MLNVAWSRQICLQQIQCRPIAIGGSVRSEEPPTYEKGPFFNQKGFTKSSTFQVKMVNFFSKRHQKAHCFIKQVHFYKQKEPTQMLSWACNACIMVLPLQLIPFFITAQVTIHDMASELNLEDCIDCRGASSILSLMAALLRYIPQATYCIAKYFDKGNCKTSKHMTGKY